MEAQVTGSQRKVVSCEVRPARLAHGRNGIAVSDGVTLPFIVSRGWSAPAGVYLEQMFLIDPQTREVLYEGPSRETAVWGLQSRTIITDEVKRKIALTPGKYAVVFALDSVAGGEFEVEAVEVAVDRV